jgi:glycerol-3-phosphate dehydrogenase (NAD(P)+)
MPPITDIIVIGSGNWGLALASRFGRNRPTRVWALNEALAKQINAHRDCPGEFFPYPLPKDVLVEAKYASGFDEKTALFILAVPSSQVRSAAAELGSRAKQPLVLSVSKGFDAERQCTMSEVVRQEIPQAKVVVLTGPTIANEVAEGKPTRAVLAGDDLMHLARVKQALANDVLSFEVSRNPTHHEICASLKGLVAIAAGLADGLALGANAQGILMTEGIREMGVVASFFGIAESVAYGISGAADLITTCISRHSRNRQLGVALAEGLGLDAALAKVNMTVEGVAMSQTIETLWALDVSIPLFHRVNGILQGRDRDRRAALEAVITSL